MPTVNQFSPSLEENPDVAEAVRAELVRRINRLDFSDRQRVEASRDVTKTATLRDDSVELKLELDDGVVIHLGHLRRGALWR